MQSPPFDLQSYIDKYSEQVTADPVQDLRKFLAASGVVATTYGGISTGYGPLAYRPKNLRVNVAAVAAIGEGLAGWYLEDVEGLTCAVRPSGVSPDFIFEDPYARAGHCQFALVEVKTSLKSGVRTSVKDVAAEMKKGVLTVLDILAKVKLIRQGLYLAYVVAIVIKAVDSFEIYRLRMEEV